MRLREVVNRIRWKYQNYLHEYFLVIVDRISESGIRHIRFDSIKHVNKNYVYIVNDLGESTAIPIHRVIRIEKVDGSIVWQRGYESASD